MAKNVIQLAIKSIQNGLFKIKGPYIDQLEKMYTLATNEVRKLNKIMWDKWISVINLGSEETSTYHNNMIKKHVKDILVELMNV